MLPIENLTMVLELSGCFIIREVVMAETLVTKYEETLSSRIDGAVIDIETIGDFDKRYKGDSREYKYLKQVILGYIEGNELRILSAKDEQGIIELAELTKEIMQKLKRPYYAFNCAFESCVWFHQIGLKIDFDGELQGRRFERKRDAVACLGISNYDDPFCDDGFKCIKAWSCGNIPHAIAHNRSCLLKERDILLKRGSTSPDILEFIK